MRNKECWYRNVCKLECTNCIRFIEISYLINNSGIPKNQQKPIALHPNGADLPEFRKLKKIKDNIVNFVERGKNLYISSKSSGTAKTSWSIKLTLKYFDSIWNGNGQRVRGLFIHTPTFLQQLKDFDNPLTTEYKELIKSCDLVVWDDIATSHMSNYEYTQLLIYIDHRILNGKSNIYTSNVTTLESLEEIVGSRLASRIFSTSKVIEFKAADGRGKFVSTDLEDNK